MSKHAPAPWSAQSDDDDCISIMSQGRIIATVYSESFVDGVPDLARLPAEANATIMAAAPDLLKALKALLGWEEALIAHFDQAGPDDFIMEMARSAIAKATGEQA